jgi:hypothetical protein
MDVGSGAGKLQQAEVVEAKNDTSMARWSRRDPQSDHSMISTACSTAKKVD